MHDPSLITIPPVEQYANRYIFNTPSFSGGKLGYVKALEYLVGVCMNTIVIHVSPLLILH